MGSAFRVRNAGVVVLRWCGGGFRGVRSSSVGVFVNVDLGAPRRLAMAEIPAWRCATQVVASFQVVHPAAVRRSCHCGRSCSVGYFSLLRDSGSGKWKVCIPHGRQVPHI